MCGKLPVIPSSGITELFATSVLHREPVIVPLPSLR